MQVRIKELEAADIALIDGYWKAITSADIERMSIDPTKLSKGNELVERLTKVLATPVTERLADPLIWQIEGRSVGMTNLNNIQPKLEAEVHLHMIDPNFRRRGLGRRLFALSIQAYFDRHSLKKIICQPAAANPGPNGLMRALGIPIYKTYRTIPSIICVEHEVNRYEMDREVIERILLNRI